MSPEPTHYSLLRPAHVQPPAPARHDQPHETELGLTPIIRALDYDGRHHRFISNVLTALESDPATIAYRQDVLADLLQLPALTATIEAVLPSLRELTEPKPFQKAGDLSALLQVVARLAELETYSVCVEQLGAALDDARERLCSAGLLGLRALLGALRAEPSYAQLRAALPELRAQLDQAGSVTLGVNLDAQLRPTSATILSVNVGQFSGKRTLYQRLFGGGADAGGAPGISALHRAEEGRSSPAENLLFQDLSGLLARTTTPLIAALRHYTQIATRQIATFEPELAFYVGAVKFADTLRATHLPLCRPQIAPPDAQIAIIEDSYSLDLALRLHATHPGDLTTLITTNAIRFDQDARILLLTGRNSGGKTTYVRAIGQAQVLFQAGLLVAGTSAHMSPVTDIFTHFAQGEVLYRDGGRLSEELERFAQIFAHAGRLSLILLNEPLTSTDAQTARVLANDLLAGLQLLNARAILVTHLHELVTDTMQHTAAPHGIVSLVATAAAPTESGASQPTYRIAPGSPQALNVAQALAQHYRLSYAQIRATLYERGVIGRTDARGVIGRTDARAPLTSAANEANDGS